MDAPHSRTLPDLIREQAARHGDVPAVICGERTVSYTGLARRAGRIAAGLRGRGVRRGDRVGLLVNNRLEWLEAFFGASMAGAVVVAFSTWSRRDELGWLLGDSGVRVLIALDHFAGQDFAEDLRALVPEADAPGAWRSAVYPVLRDIVLVGEEVGPGFTRYADLAAEEPLAPPPPGEDQVKGARVGIANGNGGDHQFFGTMVVEA